MKIAAYSCVIVCLCVVAGRSAAYGEVDAPVREEIAPVSGIEILIRGRNVKRVAIQPGNKELKTTKTEDGILIKVPPVGLHAMVVAEM